MHKLVLTETQEHVAQDPDTDEGPSSEEEKRPIIRDRDDLIHDVVKVLANQKLENGDEALVKRTKVPRRNA